MNKQFKRNPEHYKERNLRIAGLPKYFDEQQFLIFCQAFGQVESVNLIVSEGVKYGNDGKLIKALKCQGSGLVCFKTPEMATDALTKISTITLEGNQLSAVRWLPKHELIKKSKYPKQYQTPVMHPPTMTSAPSGSAKPPSPSVLWQPKQMSPKVPALTPQPAGTVIPGIDMAAFNTADDQSKKRMLETIIHQKILRKYNEILTSKLTGMIIEMSILYLIELVIDDAKLDQSVNAAKEILKRYLQLQPGNNELIASLNKAS